MARIKAKKSFKTLKVPGALTRGRVVLDGMFNKDNPNFTDPPPAVDAPTFKNSLDELAVRYSESLDGGKKAKEALKKAFDAVIHFLDLLAHHAETYSKNDMTIFLSSGFEAASTARTSAGPLAQPTIESTKQGSTGQAVIKLKAVRGARSYLVQYGLMGPDGAPPASWSSTPAIKAKPATRIDGLQPGKMYAFQVRALGPDGYTDWSPSLTRIVI
jgi:hypothetical protein